MVVVRCLLLVLVVSARGPVVRVVVVVMLRFGIFGGCSCKGEIIARGMLFPNPVSIGRAKSISSAQVMDQFVVRNKEVDLASLLSKIQSQ